jgi:hypothetical protein
MSDELRLPDDLAACEARLASEPLPASRIDRDQLMYRAGWAACEAQLASENPSSLLKNGIGSRTSAQKFGDSESGERACPTFQRAARRRVVAAWSLASAALAASIAVAVTLQLGPTSSLDVGNVKQAPATTPVNQNATPTNGSATNLAAGGSSTPSWAAASQPLDRSWSLPFISGQPLTLAARFDRAADLLGKPASAAVEDTSIQPPKTAWQLMQEYLPQSPLTESKQSTGLFWMLRPQRHGETI